MPEAPEQVQGVASLTFLEQALKNLDQQARRMDRRLSETRDDIAKSKAEYEQIVAAIAERREELKTLDESKAAQRKALDDHRDTQLKVLEAAHAALDAQAAQIEEEARASEAKEQRAQAAVSRLSEARETFAGRLKALRQAVGDAVDACLKA